MKRGAISGDVVVQEDRDCRRPSSSVDDRHRFRQGTFLPRPWILPCIQAVRTFGRFEEGQIRNDDLDRFPGNLGIDVHNVKSPGTASLSGVELIVH